MITAARNVLRVENAFVESEASRLMHPSGIHHRTKVKPIPPELRRPKIKFSAESNPFKRFIWRLKEDSQFLRQNVQLAFVLLCIWIGIEFYFFMQWGLANGSYFERPPGAEGFLPISALMSFKYWIQTGIINDVHPAALFILLAIVAVSVVLKKSFCSWLCPVGTLSESLWMLGQKLFKRNLTVNRWLDYPLRSVKYLLLLFFSYSIWQMDIPSLANFIYSPYNKVADIKMYLFFAEIAGVALWTVMILAALSIVVNNFWCRYLCPYGALLGIAGWLSPLKITRTKSTCVDCELCTKACPSHINVHAIERVWSDECTSCLECVAVCPVKDTLNLRASKTSSPVPNWVLGMLVAGVFVAITGMAMLTGHWQNGMTKAEYYRRIQQLDAPIYQHFRGQVPQYGPND